MDVKKNLANATQYAVSQATVVKDAAVTKATIAKDVALTSGRELLATADSRNPERKPGIQGAARAEAAGLNSMHASLNFANAATGGAFGLFTIVGGVSAVAFGSAAGNQKVVSAGKEAAISGVIGLIPFVGPIALALRGAYHVAHVANAVVPYQSSEG
jgi:hypothetical protein